MFLKILIAITAVLAATNIQAQGIPVPGRLAAEYDVTVKASMPGVISQLNASVGNAVNKSDTVVTLRCNVAKAQVNAAYARVGSAKADLASKRQLAASGTLPKHELALAKAALAAAEADAGVAVATRKRCTLKAPVDGTVVATLVDTGDYVSVGEPLYRIVGGKLIAVGDLDGRLYGQIKKGGPIRIEVAKGEPVDAVVTKVSPLINQNRRFYIEAELSSILPEWIPGMEIGFKLKGTPDG